MTILHRLTILRELRERAGLTQSDMARLCGLQGRQSQQTAGAWERGEIIPSRARRAKFIGYLWDHLRLREDPQHFQSVWDILVNVWGWEPIEDREWRSFTHAARPHPARPQADAGPEANPGRSEPSLGQAHPQIEAGIEASGIEATGNTSAQSTHPTTEYKSYDAILYTQTGNTRQPELLVGRGAVLRDAFAQLEQAKHILLTGYGGTGKTALAATLAEQWLAQHKSPVLWLSVESEDIDSVLEALMVPFDAQDALLQKRAFARLKAVETTLNDSGIGLLVLDNVEEISILAQVRRAIPKDLPLLVTSRYDAAHMDATFKIQELEPVDAIRLLAHHAQNPTLSFEAYQDNPHTRGLCAKLSHHALGIVIAGGWLKQSRRPPQDLLRRIESAHVSPLTLEIPPAARQPGQETVELVLSQTLHLISDAANQLFRAWGTLPAPQATSELFSVYLDMDIFSAESGLDELVAWNFAERQESNLYILHEMIHRYACHYRAMPPTRESTQSTAAPVQELPTIEQALIRYLDTYAEDFQSVQHNLGNLLAAAESSNDRERVALLKPLVLFGFFDTYGYRRAALLLLERALAYLRAEFQAGQMDDEERELLHYFLGKRGNAAFNQGDYLRAADEYRAALELAPNFDRQVMLTALSGKALCFAGLDDEGIRYLDEAAEMIVDDDYLRSFVLEQEAHIAGYKEDYDTARRIAMEQVTINRRLLAAEPEAGNFEALFRSLINWGTAELRSAQSGPTHVLTIHQEAMQLAQHHANKEWEAHALWALGEDYHLLGDRNQAQIHLQAALALYQEQEKLRDANELLAFVTQHHYSLPTVNAESL